MPEQVFKSPGYFDREIDLSAKVVQPSGTPVGIIGASMKGPAFVPVTLGSFSDFITKFGDKNPKLAAPYAVEKWLDYRYAATFIRVLGAGANTTDAEMEDTRIKGIVKNAGFKLTGSAVGSGDNRYKGAVQFIVAKHVVTGTEAYGMPMFTDNASYFTTGSSSEAYLVRGMLFTAYDTRFMVMNISETFTGSMDDAATIDNTSTSTTYKKFKLVLSSSSGSAFGNTDGYAGLRILTASLNPTDADYIGKILNTDPEKFETERHLLYCDFSVDDEIATVSTSSNAVAILSGSANTSTTSGDTALALRDAFGRFDTRYTTPKTSWFISQPFGQTEYNLFYVEAIDDGAYANNKYKVSIANVRASSDPKNEYGTFALLVRDFNDTDLEPKILEQYNNLNLDPTSDQYIAKVIGDSKLYYNFDVVDEDDRRLVREGTNPNKSKYIRVVMDPQVTRRMVPGKVLPFGFRGMEILNTNTNLTDAVPTGGVSGSFVRLAGSGSLDPRLLSAVVPPMPYRFKVTRGETSTSPTFTGYPGANEVVDTRFYWGVKFERNLNVLNPNISNEKNLLVDSFTKFQGIKKLDVLVTGSKTDDFNSNKFTLARVALSNTTLTDVTGAASVHMKEAAYIRNGTVDPSEYTVSDTNGNRVTLATLLMKSTASSDFNRFSEYTKFTTVMAGGWDGVNILDKHAARMNDKATSAETGGGSNASFVSPGFSVNQSGTGKTNGTIFSYQTAVKVATDAVASDINILAIPGIREPFVTDDASTRVRDFGKALYVMDIPYYDYNTNRIYDGETGRYVDVKKTADQFEARAIDNDHVAAYFPNVVIDDTTNNRKVVVPASVAAVAALGYNDKVSFPWFAPAGFNRAALSFVSLTQVRIGQPDRERLYDVRINPIVKFPREGYVIFSQKTLKQQKSALDSINVKRMILEVKRQITDIGLRATFGQITAATRADLVKQFNAVLSQVQTKGGIEMFQVICDETNNTQADVDANRMNCNVRLVPTRAVEFISIDFIVTQSGVQFV